MSSITPSCFLFKRLQILIFCHQNKKQYICCHLSPLLFLLKKCVSLEHFLVFFNKVSYSDCFIWRTRNNVFVVACHCHTVYSIRVTLQNNFLFSFEKTPYSYCFVWRTRNNVIIKCHYYAANRKRISFKTVSYHLSKRFHIFIVISQEQEIIYLLSLVTSKLLMVEVCCSKKRLKFDWSFFLSLLYFWKL